MNNILAILSAIGAAIFGLLVTFLYGKNKGKKDEQIEQLKMNVEQAASIKKQNDNIDRLGVSEIREKMKKEFSSEN